MKVERHHAKLRESIPVNNVTGSIKVWLSTASSKVCMVAFLLGSKAVAFGEAFFKLPSNFDVM